MKILSLEVPTNSLNQTKCFYADILELQIHNTSSNSVSFLIGHSILTFTENQDKNVSHHFAFNIPRNKIQEALTWLSVKLDLMQNSDGEYITDFKNWNAHSLYFFDNNKNILEFIARHDLDNASEVTFNSSSILSISEVGIVAYKPLVLAEKLVNEEGLYYFEKGPKGEDFVVLGDDNGLIVISCSKRNWYPTNRTAEKHALKMKVEVNNSFRQINVVR